MHAQSPQCVLRRHYLLNGLLHPDIPQFDLAVPTPRHELSVTSTLQMHISDPLLVLAPAPCHCHGGFQALVEDADGAVAVAGAEDVASYGVGG